MRKGHDTLSYLEGYGQACQDIATELFEEIEKIGFGTLGSIYILPEMWQSLKDKYLGDKTYSNSKDYCTDCNSEAAVELKDCPRYKSNPVGYVDKI